MRRYPFVTVDVFTDRRFGGNPLGVFFDAAGLSDAEMQSLAAELNLSETTFVLPPSDAANTVETAARAKVPTSQSMTPHRKPTNGPNATSAYAYGPPVEVTRLPASAKQRTIRPMARPQTT